jgi:hypothetical protein
MLNIYRSVQFRQFALIACAVAVPLGGQSGSAPYEHTAYEDLVTRTLLADGFSNVATVVEGQRVFVTFENTRYRDLRRALREVATRLLPAGGGAELVLVPTVDGVPLGTATFRKTEMLPAPSMGPSLKFIASVDTESVPERLLATSRASSSFGRVDVVLHPWLEARLGQRTDVGSRIGIAPELRISLRKGATLNAQLLLTVHDDIRTGESRLRPGLVALKQRIRLPHRAFLSLTVGSFIPDKYGVTAELRSFSKHGTWSWGGIGALTGGASYDSRDWYYTSPANPTMLANLSFRSVHQGFSVTATAGIVREQQLLRVDLRRQFGETDWGFFAVIAEEGTNGGFNIRVPLIMSRYPRPRPVRFRFADAVQWEYLYRDSPAGRSEFRAGDSIDEMLRWLGQY